MSTDLDTYIPRPRWTWNACTGRDPVSHSAPARGDNRDAAAETIDAESLRAALGLSPRDPSLVVGATPPRLSWHLAADGTYRVVAVWWGAVDVLRRWSAVADTPRDMWNALYAADVLDIWTWRNVGAYRSFLMVGRASDRAVSHVRVSA